MRSLPRLFSAMLAILPGCCDNGSTSENEYNLNAEIDLCVTGCLRERDACPGTEPPRVTCREQCNNLMARSFQDCADEVHEILLCQALDDYSDCSVSGTGQCDHLAEPWVRCMVAHPIMTTGN